MPGPSEDSEVVRRLDFMVRLLAIEATRGLPRAEQILLLRQVGMDISEIAATLALKPNTVSVSLYQAKKRPKRKEVPNEPERTD